jgi:hypothetical protein
MYSAKLMAALIICMALSFVISANAGEKKLNVSKGGRLSVNINYGEINITTWNNNQVVIKSDADEDGDNGEGLQISQSGNSVSVEDGNNFGGSDVYITVPAEFNLDIRTNAGSVTIKGNIAGKVDLGTSGGDIKTENVYGSLDANTSGGNISTWYIKGQTNINSGGGDIRLGDIEGDLILQTGGGNVKVGKITKSLKLKTGGGNIVVNEIGKDASMLTGGGNISVEKANGKIEMTTGGGDIKLNSPKGEVIARTGSGSIYVQNAAGKMNLNTGSGEVSINFLSFYNGNSELKTKNGDVTLYLPGNIKATVTCRVSTWDSSDEDENITDNIKSDFTVTTIDKKGKNDDYVTAVYKINGGGSAINVYVSNGSVVLKKK